MTSYLVAISIGPVQSFIEASRRSQDLWCGSWLLSEAARAVAYHLDQSQPGCLIFPSPSNPDSELCPRTKTDNPEANVSNVIRAEIKAKSATELKQLIAQAKAAAHQRLASIASDVLNEQLKGLPINIDRWRTQQTDLIETFAAWVSDTTDYKAASKRLGQLLTARKNTRNFSPITDSQTGLPKSSLDGANNSLTHQIRNKQQRLRLGLSQKEQLDALGIVKRCAGRLDQFTPISRIAAHDWLMSLTDEQRKGLQGDYRQLLEMGLATAVKGNGKVYEKFPYDAEYLYDTRLISSQDLDNPIKDALRRKLSQIPSQPATYAVLLKADGDRMGELLNQSPNAESSRDISKQLHCFANEARTIISQHNGQAIYTGGDDVLALLPLSSAFGCAQALAELFRTRMQTLAKTLSVQVPTLSAGLAVGHFVQPMRQLRHRASQAEKIAKGSELPLTKQRNAFAISIGLRSGHEVNWRCRWDEQENIEDFQRLIQAFSEKALPSRIMQDVRQMSQTIPGYSQYPDACAGIVSSEFERLLRRAKPNNGDETINQALKETLHRQLQKTNLQKLADQLFIARWLAAKTAADLGESS